MAPIMGDLQFWNGGSSCGGSYRVWERRYLFESLSIDFIGFGNKAPLVQDVIGIGNGGTSRGGTYWALVSNQLEGCYHLNET